MCLYVVPPEHIKVNVEPNVVSEGNLVKLYCNVSSSHPKAEISWWRDGTYQITDNIVNYTEYGQFGGNLTFSELTLNATADMHLSNFTCRATNPTVMQSISDSAEVNVLCKLLQHVYIIF